MSSDIERNSREDLEKTSFISTTTDAADEPSRRTLFPVAFYRLLGQPRRRNVTIQRLLGICILSFLVLVGVWLYHGPIALLSDLDRLNDVFNATLGFEKVYVVSLPTRTDRRDAIAVAARLTGFEFEWSDGVLPDDIADQAIPESWDFKRENKAVLATWRSHMNLLQKIVHENIATALIFEDDSDWDITFKAQLAQFATGVRLVSSDQSTSSAISTAASSPYGHDWHLLWPGTCRMSPSDNTTRFYVQSNDLTVPPPSRRWAVWSSPHRPLEAQQSHSRMTFRADGTGMCMYAYAVTQVGAQKMLAQMAMRPQRKPVDVLVRNMCRGENAATIGAFDCYGVYPTLVGSHRAEGLGSHDSDNREMKAVKHPEYTHDIVYSTTINAARILAGGQPAMAVAQWVDDVTRKSLDIDEDFAATVGTGSLRAIDMRKLKETEVLPLVDDE